MRHLVDYTVTSQSPLVTERLDSFRVLDHIFHRCSRWLRHERDLARQRIVSERSAYEDKRKSLNMGASTDCTIAQSEALRGALRASPSWSHQADGKTEAESHITSTLTNIGQSSRSEERQIRMKLAADLDALEKEHKRTLARLEAEERALSADQTRLQIELANLKACRSSLQELQIAPEGLAPWDAEFLASSAVLSEARRAIEACSVAAKMAKFLGIDDLRGAGLDVRRMISREDSATVIDALAKEVDTKTTVSQDQRAALPVALSPVERRKGAPVDDENPMMTATEVAARFRERLGVSRSAFYRRFRRLLRAVELDGGEITRYTDGLYYWTETPGVKRFRRVEVEALMAYLESGGGGKRRVRR